MDPAIAQSADASEPLQTSADLAKCDACGEPIENPKRGQRFCYWPRRCRKSQWADQHRRPYLIARAPRPCEFCGEPIDNPRRDQRFCRKPRNCSSLAWNHQNYSAVATATKYMAKAGARIVEGARDVAVLPAVVSAAKRAWGSEVSPMIGILLESLPAPGASWPAGARAQWQTILDRALDRIFPASASYEASNRN